MLDRATLKATHSLPIIMAAIDYDPIKAGLVTNIGRPTGNVTVASFRSRVPQPTLEYPYFGGGGIIWKVGMSVAVASQAGLSLT